MQYEGESFVNEYVLDHSTFGTLEDRMDGRPFRYYDNVSSTNDVARDWQMADPNIPSGSVVLTEEQTGGRGRIGRRWHTPRGQAIAMSVVLRPKIDPDDLQRVTMMAGLAVAETVSHFLAEETRSLLTLKWPNDVLLDGRKICGILSEAVWFGNDLQAVILGIGLNIRVDFRNSPLESIATSIETHTHNAIDRLDVIVKILERLDFWEKYVATPLLHDTWRSWLSTLGQTITFKTVQGTFEGVAVDVDSNGALILKDNEGRHHRVMVGDVLETHRP